MSRLIPYYLPTISHDPHSKRRTGELFAAGASDPSEVAEIIETDLDFLFNPEKQKETVIHVRGADIEAPYYDVKNKIVWGATAMILSELQEVIKRIGSSK